MAVSNAMHLIRGALIESTYVTFPKGATKGESRIVDVAKMVSGKIALLLAETPFHPVDKAWPDQPADKGTIQLGQQVFPVEDCQIFSANRETRELLETSQVPKGERGMWFPVVAHVINPREQDSESFIDAKVVAEVDVPYRNSLSQHHTACHLAAVALNRATNRFWSKEGARKDTLGSFDLDHEAMETSAIFEDQSEDVYRFGKSIKKKGLQVDELFANLETVQLDVNNFLKKWISTGAEVTIQCAGGKLDNTRTWNCKLPDGRVASMPCGGSHAASLSELPAINYRLEALNVDGERKLRAITTISL